ncbi:hypothetical protein [Bacillus pseudomycoides]|uniref:hypothetical protein n=1 Tax=Bacillus pseudomycoides TaxID=64104 RepID=UPI000BEF5D16|nr:hypothetical protein [Bacillus pseudomycoides]PEI52393.1 hypothetical protein CN641_00395 [Bacillus pseudomycoides]PHE91509.1 hypothetical protein COF78_19105 [Bacillus pseudomycoides]
MALFNEKELEQHPSQRKVVEKEKAKAERKAFRFNERELEQQPRFKSKAIQEEKKVEKKRKTNPKEKEKKKTSSEKPDVKKKNDKSTGFFSRKKREVPPKVKKSIAEIMQVVDMTEDGIFELKNGEFLEVLQVEGEDMYSKNNEEQAFVIFSHAYFYQAYKHAIKLIFLNFPCQTTEQQKYINKKIRECDNPLYERILVQKLKELKFLEWGRTNREALLFIYGDSELIVKERVDAAKRYIQRSTELLDIDEDKKLEILFKLFNQNAKLGTKNI